MKVLKFGGSSIGSPENILLVLAIIKEKAKTTASAVSVKVQLYKVNTTHHSQRVSLKKSHIVQTQYIVIRKENHDKYIEQKKANMTHHYPIAF